MKNKDGQAQIKFSLVGNPNTGKTTLFNCLSDSDEHVGNWHGVTVDFKEKLFNFGDKKIKIVDLPGIYSLSSYSFEEQVSRDYIYKKEGLIINVCDANNLGRNLYLTLQLLEFGLKPIVLINMANEVEKQGKIIDVKKLEKLLNIKIFLVNAQNKKQVKNIFEDIVKNYDNYYQQQIKNQVNTVYFNNIPKDKIKSIVDEDFNNLQNINQDYVSIKIIEKDEYILNSLKLSAPKIDQLKTVWKNFDESYIATKRYLFIDEVIKQCVQFKNKTKSYGLSVLDKIVLNKYLALPLFLLIICFVFFLTFSSVGSFLSNIINNFVTNCIFSPLITFIKSNTNNMFVIDFFNDAVFGGIASILSFLPQITILFLSLTILEDSGYMSRLAFTLEDFFSRVGLTGKSVFTLLMGFGCSTTACLTCRNLEDKNSKIKTAMLSPYISCTAKIPIYTVICGAFFFKFQLLVIILLYLLSVLVSMVVSLILEKTVLKSGEQSFIMELPPYRLPKLNRIFKVVLSNIKAFLLRVGTLIIAFSIIIWILQSCDFKFCYNPQNSILKTICTFIAPMFNPLGFGSWGAVACLVCGVVAKEIIVGTMGIINNISVEQSNANMLISQSLLLSASAFSLDSCSAISFLVFSLLYMPCVSTIGVMKKEIGLKWTIFAIFLQFGIAYLLSYLTYKIAICFSVNGVLSGIISCIVFVSIVVAVILVKKVFKTKSGCKYCINNKKCLK